MQKKKTACHRKVHFSVNFSTQSNNFLTNHMESHIKTVKSFQTFICIVKTKQQNMFKIA